MTTTTDTTTTTATLTRAAILRAARECDDVIPTLRAPDRADAERRAEVAHYLLAAGAEPAAVVAALGGAVAPGGRVVVAAEAHDGHVLDDEDPAIFAVADIAAAAAEYVRTPRDWMTPCEDPDTGAQMSALWMIGVRVYVADRDGWDEVEDGAEHVVHPDPPETDCGTADEDHDWRAPYAVVGGCRESPGVWGCGGTALEYHEVCAKCGITRRTYVAGSQRNPGDPPETVAYDTDDREAVARWHADMIGGEDVIYPGGGRDYVLDGSATVAGDLVVDDLDDTLRDMVEAVALDRLDLDDPEVEIRTVPQLGGRIVVYAVWPEGDNEPREDLPERWDVLAIAQVDEDGRLVEWIEDDWGAGRQAIEAHVADWAE